LNQAVFLEAGGAVLKIGSSLKTNHPKEIELAQFRSFKVAAGISLRPVTFF